MKRESSTLKQEDSNTVNRQMKRESSTLKLEDNNKDK